MRILSRGRDAGDSGDDNGGEEEGGEEDEGELLVITGSG